jgi:hypothetical protein
LELDIESVAYAISGAIWGAGQDGGIVVVDILRVELGDERGLAALYLHDDGWRFPVVNARRCTHVGREWMTVPPKNSGNGWTMVGMEKVGEVSVELKRDMHCVAVVVHCVGANKNTHVALNVSGTIYYRL